ncbi:hypothetical protein JTB14_010340 [Gonioctena quinquepunctata]|nr:hypothetical protein JTB14_010340 [Gonioctena quinquepunctata]
MIEEKKYCFSTRKCLMRAGFMLNRDIDDFDKEDNMPQQLFPNIKGTFLELKQFAYIDSYTPTVTSELTITNCIEGIQDMNDTTPNSTLSKKYMKLFQCRICQAHLKHALV